MRRKPKNMKQKIHPKWYTDAKVICACGNTFTVGATVEEIRTELCAKCHPFYTGEQRIVDSANKVSDFNEKVKKAHEKKQLLEKLKDAKKKRAETRKVGTVSISSSLKDLMKDFQ